MIIFLEVIQTFLGGMKMAYVKKGKEEAFYFH
jgi:hypothetical protein